MPQRTGETVREPGRKPPRCGITHLFVGTRAEEEGSGEGMIGEERRVLLNIIKDALINYEGNVNERNP